MTSTLQTMIDKFLSERRHSAGGWAEVQLQDVKDLCAILSELIKRKFEADPDGDLPIEYTIVDRTRFDRMRFEPVPYHHKAQNLEEKQTILDAHMYNLNVAHIAVTCIHNVLRNERTRNKK